MYTIVYVCVRAKDYGGDSEVRHGVGGGDKVKGGYCWGEKGGGDGVGGDS